MLRLALLFLVVALIAGLFGFGVVASAAAEIAQVIFWIFLVFFVVSLLGGLISGRGVA
ncbi:MAG TPA: DUF1328 domain-containing protein [Anaerolineales bacterium]|nr:DUF1328 domain-containing protein [Anaerolineales bacterium]